MSLNTGINRTLSLTALFLAALIVPVGAQGQQVETSLPTSPRVTINLSGGMPGQSQWLYVKDQDSTSVTSPTFATTTFNDSAWTPVGIPYSANLLTSFLNADSGGGDGDLNGNINWYRLHFTLGSQYASSKILVEFEGAHTGAQVFINGTLLPGISAVAANAQASHVVGFIPFIVDLTPYVIADGSTQNVLSVRVSRNSSWFEQPGFSQDYRFGQADAGLFRPAYMFITNRVHIPVNIYSNQKTWGTYVATVSEVASGSGTAQAASAVVEVQTNVLNESTSSQQVTLTTQIVDATGKVVATAPPITQTVAAMTPSNFPSTATPMFDQQITVNNPTLWYPNNSTFGTPYLYRIYHVVSVNGVVVDAAQSPLGIRTITWDHNFPYFNGHPMFLWGASGRYDYPALGSSVPEEQQWRDLALMAAEGGNIWRPGHSTTSEEFVNAADAYGIMIDQPSGDGEGAFASPSADMVTLKEELHRDMIIRDRSHPSILDWEANNGTSEESVGETLHTIAEQWDPINTRVEADRTPDPVNGYMLGCTLEGCEVGIKNQFPNNPAWGSEYWGNGTGRGLAWDYELAFAAPFLDNWRKGRAANAFGMAQWYFADSPGEDSLYAEFSGTPSKQSMVRSLGASSVDMNRFPKMLYYIYEAAWTPFSIKPVVHLAHHWNRSGAIQVNAFSNCPSVRLLINGAAQGADQVPNNWNSDSSTNLTQSTTLMPFQVHWNVTWVSGTVQAACLDQYGNVAATDTRVTAGAEDHIVLTVVPEVTKPNGTTFTVTANGSDAAFVTAQVVDANGNVVPTAADTLTFSVSGPATYMGGSQQYVSTATDAYSAAHSELNYHAPGDPQLQVEGGLTKIAIRSQFTTGTVTVTATAPGLKSGTASYTIQPVPSVTPPATAPAIIVPPLSTAVTVGQKATFSVTAAGTTPLTFQWTKNSSAISGATGASYTTPATVSGDNNASFTVTVSNSLGSAASSPATLTVVTAASVAITTQPASQSASVGQTVKLSVTATGSPTLTYQWQKNGAAIAGATNSGYTTPVLTASDNGDSFKVVISNPVNTVTSAAAVLTVAAAVAPGITQQPASQAVLANNPVTFSVGVSGSSPFSYQWQLNGSNLLGATSSTYSILEVQSSNVGTYTVIVSNAAGSVTSPGATLSIAPPGVNLAINRPATASSYQDSVGMPASNAFDGDLTTRWSSQGGIDPSYIQVDLGSVQAFDNVILYWEAAYATVYQIQYSTDNSTWTPAYTNNDGVGGIENLTFPTVRGRYVRMYGQTRATPYGYSLYEMQVYDIAQCGGSGERYTVLSPTSVKDNASGLTWQRAETTYASGGAQYTQSIAQSYCSSQSMRLPTQPEALAISGASSASCAFPNAWNTWTSTADPSNSSDAGFVTSTGQATWQVANNYPGAVLCTAGTSTTTPLTIKTQPAAQTVAAGQTATFSVVASGSGTLSYQWSKNGAAVSGAIGASYTTPATVATDNGALFAVTVKDSTGASVTSNSALLTVTSGGSSGTDVIAINAGGTAAGTFAADEDFSGGGAATTPNTIATAGVANAAPAAVYQSERSGVFTYTIPGLTAGTSYMVRLHFAEFYWSQAGQRVFNVSINGASVLTNFDIVATAGANKALVESFTASASSSGQIVISFTAGSADQPKVSGIEIAGSSTTPLTIKTQPTAQTVALGQTATFSLSASGSGTLTYQWSKNGGTISGATAASYTTPATVSTDNGALFAVTVKDSTGASVTSNSAALTVTGGSSSGADILAINSGGAATGTFAADEDFSGGGTAATASTIATAGVTNAAPAAVYQSERAGVFTYTIPGLAAGTNYTVRLHFAEFYWTQAGQRIFNVSINGASVLKNFDIVATAGANKALVEAFTATASSSGQIVISFTAGSADQPKVSGIEIAGPTGNSVGRITPAASSSGPDVAAINSGGAATGSFAADEGFSGGGAASTTNTIVTTGVANAAPVAVYQSERAGAFTYTIPGLTAGASYTVRLHFAEFYWTKAGQRIFNVSINGASVLKNFDIVATAGANQALVETFAATASSSGQVVISFTAGSADQPKVSGIEIAGTSTTTPLTIKTQPAAQTATVGQKATFSVVASGGSGALTYQWSKNGSSISGATAVSYTTPATVAADNGALFAVTVKDSTGTSIMSNSATLAVTGGSSSGVDLVAINSGGPATGSFAADEDVSGGGAASTTNTIATAGVANAAPQAVYQFERNGVFTYTIPGLTAGTSYTVRLHFAEFYWTQAGQRVFNVNINGTSVLKNFDILATAGVANKALVETFTETATSSGQIVISFTSGPADQPKVSGIEIAGSGSGGGSGAPKITTQPASQTVAIGTTATFSVAVSVGSPFTYQWGKNNVAIPGATAASYNTPTTSAPDNGAVFNVTVTNSAGSVISANASLTVNSSPAYTVYSGFIGTDLNNNTHGAWQDNQIYVTIIGTNPTTGALSWVNYDGTETACSVSDNTAPNSVKGPDGQTYPGYGFTLAQSNHLLKLPPLASGRIYISEGSPVYMKIMPGNPLGYAGPNPLNSSDPNINVHYDWYELNWGGANDAIFINTTQVDEFGLPLTLDVWGSKETFHMQTGITESVAAIDQEFVNETPAAFHTTPISNLRIFSPANSTFNTGEANAHYFDGYVSSVWSYYATNSLTVFLYNGSREFTGKTQGSSFVFTEVNQNNGAYVGGTYTVGEPSTQEILFCSGTLATGNSVESALEAQFCAAFNRSVMESYSQWTIPADYYQLSPTNSYAEFWHKHSIGGLAYGFAYDDVNIQSSSIVSSVPEHMAFGISW